MDAKKKRVNLHVKHGDLLQVSRETHFQGKEVNGICRFLLAPQLPSLSPLHGRLKTCILGDHGAMIPLSKQHTPSERFLEQNWGDLEHRLLPRRPTCTFRVDDAKVGNTPDSCHKGSAVQCTMGVHSLHLNFKKKVQITSRCSVAGGPGHFTPR